jgi:hypothetical protein
MKTNFYCIKVLIALSGLLMAGASQSQAQVGQPWSPGVPEVLSLMQADVGEGTVMAFIQNSGRSYALNANEIIMLKQQGFTDKELSAMLQAHAPIAVSPVQPAPTYVVQQAPVYVAPAPVYSSWPAVNLSFAWGSGYGYYGGGYYGGNCGRGYYGGGCYHH